jgi:hypothetical protein
VNKINKASRSVKMKKDTGADITISIIIVLIASITALACLKQSLAITEPDLQTLKSDLLSIGDLKAEMAEKGFGIIRISEIMTEGYVHLKDENYAAANKSVISAKNIRDDAFSGYSLLTGIDEMIKDINSTNQKSGKEQVRITDELMWSIGFAKEEFEKENYEEALSRAERIRNVILMSARQRYGPMEESLASITTEMMEKGISTRRMTTLKNLVDGYLKEGIVSELQAIEDEIIRINSTLVLYSGVESSITMLDEMNLSSSRTKDGLESAAERISAGEYDQAETIIQEQDGLIKKAVSLHEEVDAFRSKLEKANEAGSLGEGLAGSIGSDITGAEHELAIGNYEGAEEKLNKAKKDMELIQAEQLVKKASTARIQTLKEMLDKAWKALLIIAIITALIIIFGRKAMLKRIRSARLKRLEKELEVTKRMINDLQTRYFVKHTMPRAGYDEAYEELQEKIMRINDKIGWLKQLKQKSATSKHS